MSRQLPGDAGARILVVEGDNGRVRLVQRELRRHGFSVELAASADAARGAFDRLRPGYRFRADDSLNLYSLVQPRRT
jgi:hypothetical protein